jgi:hypothetical protein
MELRVGIQLSIPQMETENLLWDHWKRTKYISSHPGYIVKKPKHHLVSDCYCFFLGGGGMKISSISFSFVQNLDFFEEEFKFSLDVFLKVIDLAMSLLNTVIWIDTILKSHF